MNREPFLFTVDEVVAATGGRLVQTGSVAGFAGVSIDSRTCLPGSLFIAIEGEHHDGHDFVPEVIRRGAAGAMVRKGAPPPPNPISGGHRIEVADTAAALGDLAAFRRRACPAHIAAVVGSNGKTSVKEMAASILVQTRRTLKTEGNYNNLIGLPLTLLRLEPVHEAAVVELGMNTPGEIARLAAIASPDVGCITNISEAHVGGFGSVEAVAREKGEILSGLRPEGTFVTNADDPRTAALCDRWPGRTLTFGSSPSARVALEEAREAGPEGLDLRLRVEGETLEVSLHYLGAHNGTNAAAAAAIGLAMGTSLEAIHSGLEAARPLPGRLRPVRLARGGVCLDDTYNANPASVEAALRTLRRLAGEAPCTAILGDMLELGDRAGELHEAIGRLAGRLGVGRLIVLGEHASSMAAGARAAGLGSDRVVECLEPDECGAAIGELAGPEQWILVKGSRAMGMERFVELIKEKWGK